jgi:hypothetical protein
MSLMGWGLPKFSVEFILLYMSCQILMLFELEHIFSCLLLHEMKCLFHFTVLILVIIRYSMRLVAISFSLTILGQALLRDHLIFYFCIFFSNYGGDLCVISLRRRIKRCKREEGGKNPPPRHPHGVVKTTL